MCFIENSGFNLDVRTWRDFHCFVFGAFWLLCFTLFVSLSCFYTEVKNNIQDKKLLINFVVYLMFLTYMLFYTYRIYAFQSLRNVFSLGGLKAPHLESIIKSQRIICCKKFAENQQSNWRLFFPIIIWRMWERNWFWVALLILRNYAFNYPNTMKNVSVVSQNIQSRIS